MRPSERVQQALLSSGACPFLHNAFARIHVPWRAQLPVPLVPPDHGCDGETVSPSPQSNSLTSAGIPLHSSVASGISLGHPRTADLMLLLARGALGSCDLVPTRSKRSAPAYWRVQLPGRYDVSVAP